VSTPLDWVALWREEELLGKLLKRGGNPNLYVNEYGSIALQNAIKQVRPILKGYVEEPEIVEIGDSIFEGNVARFIITGIETSQKGVRMVKMLVDAGAKVTPKTLEILEEHEKKEVEYWQHEIKSRGISQELGQKVLEDLKTGVEEVRKMLIERLEKEKSLPSLREEGPKTKVYS
jgi:hypothetical protein